MDWIQHLVLLVIMSEGAIPDIFSGDLLDAEWAVLRFPYRYAAHIRAMRQHDIEEISGQNRQPLKVMLFKIRMPEAETRDSNSKLRQVHRLEFLCSENMHIPRPGFFSVRRSLDTGIMISGRDEYAYRIQACQLLFDEFEGIRSNAFEFKKISGDKHEINFMRPGIFNDTAESASNGLPFPVSQAVKGSRTRRNWYRDGYRRCG